MSWNESELRGCCHYWKEEAGYQAVRAVRMFYYGMLIGSFVMLCATTLVVHLMR